MGCESVTYVETTPNHYSYCQSGYNYDKLDCCNHKAIVVSVSVFCVVFFGCVCVFMCFALKGGCKGGTSSASGNSSRDDYGRLHNDGYDYSNGHHHHHHDGGHHHGGDHGGGGHDGGDGGGGD